MRYLRLDRTNQQLICRIATDCSNYIIKIPIKHFYDDGILKTMVPWTGDVWKVLYHILLFYRENIEFSHFYNLNYRGVAVLQIKQKFRIPDADIVSINAYNYTTDFKAYMDLFAK